MDKTNMPTAANRSETPEEILGRIEVRAEWTVERITNYSAMTDPLRSCLHDAETILRYCAKMKQALLERQLEASVRSKQ